MRRDPPRPPAARRPLPARLLATAPASGRGLIGLCLCLWAVAPLAWGAEIQIESPAFTFDREREVYIYENARVTLGSLVIEAVRIEIDGASGVLEATGRVRFREGALNGSAERLVLDTESGTGVLYKTQLYDGNTGYYLRAEELVRAEEGVYTAKQCSLTNCPPDAEAWRIEAATLEYRSDDFALSWNTVLKLGGVPVLWSPVFGWPTVDERRSGFLAPSLKDHGSSKRRYRLGTEVALPYFLALDVDHDVTITPEIYSRRGTALHLDYRYAFTRGMTAQLEGWGIQETSAREPGAENDILPTGESAGRDDTPQRYWLKWGHNQEFGAGGRAVMNLARGGDGQVWREYEGEREYRPALDYQASWSGQWDSGDPAVTAEHTSEYEDESIYADRESFTDGAERPQLSPRLSYSGGWHFGDAPLGLEIAAAATRFVTDEGASGTAQWVRPGLAYPLRLGGSLQLRPFVGWRFVRYSDLEIDDDLLATPSADRPDWLTDAESLDAEEGFGQPEARIELLLPLARRFDREEGPWQAIKHRVTPRLIYRQIGDVEQPLAGLLLRPEPALRLLTLRLDNLWLALPRAAEREGGAAVSTVPRVLGALNFIQRYNFLLDHKDYTPSGPALPSPGETDPGQPLLPAIVEGSWSTGGFDTSLYLRYHHQRGRMVEYRLALHGKVSEKGSMSIAYADNESAYRTPENKFRAAESSLEFDGTLAPTGRVTYGFDGRVNLFPEDVPLNRRITRGQVYVDYHPLCYSIRLSYLEEVDATTEYNAGTGEDEDVYFVNRQVLLTFTIGGVATSSRGYRFRGDQ